MTTISVDMVVAHHEALRQHFRRQIIRLDTAKANGQIDAAEHDGRIADLLDFVGRDTVGLWIEFGQLGSRGAEIRERMDGRGGR